MSIEDSMQVKTGAPLPVHNYSQLQHQLHARQGDIYALVKGFQSNFDPAEDTLPQGITMAAYAAKSPDNTRQVAQLICTKIAVGSSREYLSGWSEFIDYLRGDIIFDPETAKRQ